MWNNYQYVIINHQLPITIITINNHLITIHSDSTYFISVNRDHHELTTNEDYSSPSFFFTNVNHYIITLSDYHYQLIWVNYHISLTWILRPFGDDFPYSLWFPVRENSEVVIIYPDWSQTELLTVQDASRPPPGYPGIHPDLSARIVAHDGRPRNRRHGQRSRR